MAAEGEFEGFPCSRDLLQRFSGDKKAPEVEGGEAGEVELSLGLSLGLTRSSSISTLPPPEQAVEVQSLTRTSSLPVGGEEEWRRRKEMQSLKRMEAMRKRFEKRARDRKAAAEEEEEVPPPPPPSLPAPAVVPGKAKGIEVEAVAPRWSGPGKPALQGSMGSQGSSSSGMSDHADHESRSLHGLDVTGLSSSKEVRSSSMPSALEHASNKALASPVLNKLANPPKESDEPSKKKRISTTRLDSAREMEKNMMDEMPCVSTRGDGPNGKSIQGFLYKYRRGEEVRIVCVCHGSFLTPAEFVKHAGGSDVDQPLKHIVVNPNPFVLM